MGCHPHSPQPWGVRFGKNRNYPNHVPGTAAPNHNRQRFSRTRMWAPSPSSGSGARSQSQDPGPSLGVVLPQPAWITETLSWPKAKLTRTTLLSGAGPPGSRLLWRPAPHREAEIQASHPESGTSRPPLGPRQKPAELSRFWGSPGPRPLPLPLALHGAFPAPRSPDCRADPRDAAGPLPPQQRLPQFRNSNSQTETKSFRDQRALGGHRSAVCATLRRRWKGLKCASTARSRTHGRCSVPENLPALSRLTAQTSVKALALPGTLPPPAPPTLKHLPPQGGQGPTQAPPLPTGQAAPWSCCAHLQTLHACHKEPSSSRAHLQARNPQPSQARPRPRETT